MHQSNPSAAVPGVGDLLLILCPAVGHFHVFFYPRPREFVTYFRKLSKARGVGRGGMGTLGFD
jgi:hypothetical protein